MAQKRSRRAGKGKALAINPSSRRQSQKGLANRNAAGERGKQHHTSGALHNTDEGDLARDTQSLDLQDDSEGYRIGADGQDREDAEGIEDMEDMEGIEGMEGVEDGEDLNATNNSVNNGENNIDEDLTGPYPPFHTATSPSKFTPTSPTDTSPSATPLQYSKLPMSIVHPSVWRSLHSLKSSEQNSGEDSRPSIGAAEASASAQLHRGSSQQHLPSISSFDSLDVGHPRTRSGILVPGSLVPPTQSSSFNITRRVPPKQFEAISPSYVHPAGPVTSLGVSLTEHLKTLTKATGKTAIGYMFDLMTWYQQSSHSFDQAGYMIWEFAQQKPQIWTEFKNHYHEQHGNSKTAAIDFSKAYEKPLRDRHDIWDSRTKKIKQEVDKLIDGTDRGLCQSAAWCTRDFFDYVLAPNIDTSNTRTSLDEINRFRIEKIDLSPLEVLRRAQRRMIIRVARKRPKSGQRKNPWIISGDIKAVREETERTFELMATEKDYAIRVLLLQTDMNDVYWKYGMEPPEARSAMSNEGRPRIVDEAAGYSAPSQNKTKSKTVFYSTPNLPELRDRTFSPTRSEPANVSSQDDQPHRLQVLEPSDQDRLQHESGHIQRSQMPSPRLDMVDDVRDGVDIPGPEPAGHVTMRDTTGVITSQEVDKVSLDLQSTTLEDGSTVKARSVPVPTSRGRKSLLDIEEEDGPDGGVSSELDGFGHLLGTREVDPQQSIIKKPVEGNKEDLVEPLPLPLSLQTPQACQNPKDQPTEVDRAATASPTSQPSGKPQRGGKISEPKTTTKKTKKTHGKKKTRKPAALPGLLLKDSSTKLHATKRANPSEDDEMEEPPSPPKKTSRPWLVMKQSHDDEFALKVDRFLSEPLMTTSDGHLGSAASTPTTQKALSSDHDPVANAILGIIEQDLLDAAHGHWTEPSRDMRTQLLLALDTKKEAPGQAVKAALMRLVDEAVDSDGARSSYVSLLRGYCLHQQISSLSDGYHQDMCKILAKYRTVFSYDRSVWFQVKHKNVKPVSLVYGDFLSLMLDDHHPGKLTGTIIYAGLLAIAEGYRQHYLQDHHHLAPPVIVDPRHWTTFCDEVVEKIYKGNVGVSAHHLPDDLRYLQRLPKEHDIYIPVHGHDHWSLIVIRRYEGRWQHLDSFKSPERSSWVKDSVSCLLEMLRLTGTVDLQRDSGPQQNDLASCGVFVLSHAHSIMFDQHPSREPITLYHRWFIMYSIWQIVEHSPQSRPATFPRHKTLMKNEPASLEYTTLVDDDHDNKNDDSIDGEEDDDDGEDGEDNSDSNGDNDNNDNEADDGFGGGDNDSDDNTKDDVHDHGSTIE